MLSVTTFACFKIQLLEEFPILPMPGELAIKDIYTIMIE